MSITALKYFRNKYEHYQVPDLLFDDLFLEWVRLGKPDEHIWARRILESVKLEETANEAERILKNLKPKTGSENPQHIEELKGRIMQKVETINMRDQFGVYNPNTNKRHYFVYAAAIVVFILLSGVLYNTLVPVSNPVVVEEPTYEIRKTKSGQKLTLHLSDGSKVKLNSDSEIKYPKYFGNTREIHLVRGEAFFEVARDEQRPFRVMAENTVTEALGTSFNINIVNNELTRVALVTGKVRVSNQDDEILLNPGNYVSCSSENISEIKAYDLGEISWKDEILIFKDANGFEIISKLEKWYGVDIQYDISNLREWKYSGRFEDQNLYQVLNSIGAVEKFEFKIQDDKVMIN